MQLIFVEIGRDRDGHYLTEENIQKISDKKNLPSNSIPENEVGRKTKICQPSVRHYAVWNANIGHGQSNKNASKA